MPARGLGLVSSARPRRLHGLRTSGVRVRVRVRVKVRVRVRVRVRV